MKIIQTISAGLLRALGIAALIFLLDQLVKYWVVEGLDLKNRLAINVWDPFLNLRMAWNDGINFGLLSGADSDIMRIALIALAMVISALVLWWGRNFSGIWGPLFIGLVVGGALGNTVDRIVYGAVADFLNMSCCGFKNPFAFNIADISIFAGAIGLALFSDRFERKS